MKSNLHKLISVLLLLVVGCTGQKDPIANHEAPKSPFGGSLAPTSQKYISAEINSIENEEDKLKKTEDFLTNEFPKSDLKTKYAAETQTLIRFAIKKWAETGKTEIFLKLVNFVFSENDVDDRIIEAFEIVDTKALVYKSIKESKDPVLKFKLLLLFKKIQQVGLSNEDLAFMQNQINSIKKETGFKFAGTSELWIKTNRDLVDQLISLGLDAKVQIDEKEYEGVNLSRAQREKMILSFLKLKKNLTQIVSPVALKEMKEYRANIAKISAEIPIFASKVKLSEIKDDNTLALIVSLLISDIDSIQVDELLKSKLIEKDAFKKGLSDWVIYEVNQVVRKYKEEFNQFQAKKINYMARDYFPEMRRALAMSQILCRERVERIRVFMPITKILDFDSLYKKLVDLDIFFKRFLTSNTTLLLLKLFSENSVQLNSEVLLNSQVIKKDTTNNLKTSITVPNVMMVSEGFYLGELADQFDFSLNDRMLQKFEVLDGIDQGINLGLFKELGFDEQDILHTLFVWLSQSRLVQVDVIKVGQLQETKVFKLHESLKLKMSSTEWKTIKGYCAGLKNDITTPREFDLEDLRSSLVFGRLAENIEASRATSESGGSNNLLSLFPYNGEVTKSLEFLRTDVSYFVLFVETVMDSLVNAGIDKSKIEAEMNHFKSFYSDYLKDYLAYIAEFDDCYYHKQKMEQALAQKVFKYEAAYWQFVLNKASGQKNVLISSIIPLSYKLPDKIAERSYFAGDSIQINSLDFFFRVKQYMQYGLSLEGQEKLPPIDTNVIINFSSKMATQKFYKDATLKGVNLQSEAVDAKIQKIVAAHDFSGSTFVNWFAKSNLSISKFVEQLDTLYILHRFGPGLKESFGIDASVSLEQMTKSYHHVVYLYHLSDGMKEVLSYVGLKELGPLDMMVRFKFVLQEAEVAFPFYDGLLKSFSMPYMGYFGDDANFMGGGDSRTIRRPMQLLSSDFIMKILYRYYDESYVAPFRERKLDFARYVNRMTQEMDITKKVVEYVEYVEQTKTEQAFKLQLRTNLELPVPLYSIGARDNLAAIALEMKTKLTSIEAVKARQKQLH